MSDTGEFAMEEFSGQEVQPYAILSHTWGEDEVCFQDMERADAANKKGYEKVKNFCSLAKANGYKYVWVDTCCIDKRSSAELSEAINSMYRWYEEADVCYAYLADVSSLSNFSDSRWFTRGWTLQELIAPSNVIFFDRDWQVIGNKADLQYDISWITRIPSNFFLGDSLGYASVAQRMSWAASRETTRIEDRAYCLLGIFGIYMPMLYGEGDRAFIRLQEEIMKGMDDHSLFAWRSTAYHDGGILASSPAAFVESGNIVSTSSFKAASSSPAISNARGIRLSVPFKYSQQRESGLAILDCTETGKENKRLAVHLRDVYLTKQEFTREENSKLELVDIGNGLPDYPLTELYVRQQRSTHNNQKGNATMCGIKLEGVEKGEIAARTFHLHSGWSLHNGMMMTTMAHAVDDKLGRLLVLCKDGASFQVLVKKRGRVVSTEVSSSFEAGTAPSQSATAPERPQGERDQSASVLGEGRYVHVAIKKRIIMLGYEKHLTNVVEISYPGTVAWLRGVALLEGRIRDTTLLSYAARCGYVAVVSLLLNTRKCTIEFKDESGMTPLAIAANRGHENVAEVLLESGADLESKDIDGSTPLSRAAASGRGTVAKLLLERGAYVDSKDENHQTPLSRAAANGNGIVVKLLLEKGANLDSKDKYNRTPIYLAAKNGRITTVKLLLDHGATYPRFMEEKGEQLLIAAACGQDARVKTLLEKGVNTGIVDKNGWTALLWAAANGHEAVVKLLLFKNGVNLESGDKHGQTSLSWAASNGHTAVVKHLLRAGANTKTVNNFGQAPLSRAAERDKDGIVQLLLDWGANMEERSADGLTPLSWAAMYGHEAITALLLRKGANIEARSDTGQTALSWSAIFGREATMRVLLDRGANIETRSGKGQTPLSWAAVCGQVNVVKILISRGANIESRSKNSYTPLLWALHNKHYPIAKLLFHKGASIEALESLEMAIPGIYKSVIGSSFGFSHGFADFPHLQQTPLCWAAENGNEEGIKMLLARDANIEGQSGNGQTPLSWAASYGQVSAVRMLLKKGAEMECRSNNGQTPLSWAATYGHVSVVELLLNKGADIESRSSTGQSPLSWAAMYGQKHMVEYLLSRGAYIDQRSSNEQTPYLWALEKGHDDTADLLRGMGADLSTLRFVSNLLFS